MALFSTTEGSLEIPDFVVAAVHNHAERMADLTAGFLRYIGMCPASDGGEPRSCGLSAGILIDLAALLILMTWDHAGLREFLPDGTPSVDDAAAAVLAHLADGACGKFSAESRLSGDVLAAWMETIAWYGHLHLQADLVIGEIDEDALVEAMAELIWTHRHDRSVDGSEGNGRTNWAAALEARAN